MVVHRAPDLSTTPWNTMRIFVEANNKEEAQQDRFIKEILAKSSRPHAAEEFLRDEPVALKGIKSRPDLNGAFGRIGKDGVDAEGRLVVYLQGEGQRANGLKVRVHPSRLEPILGSAANLALLGKLKLQREAMPGGDRWPRAQAATEAGVVSVRTATAGSSAASRLSRGASAPELPRNPAEIARRMNNAVTMYPSVLPRIETPPGLVVRNKFAL
eukprot:SRR837773.19682.p2 GENE.SRR837773.19682~~SRR837773.19682.p2  ORF type:complete len:230 (+),score=68.48 SRR837773.19682:50-691(+)